MTCVSSLSPLSLRLVRSIKPNTGLTASVAALMTDIIFLAADLAVAQLLTHGPVVGQRRRLGRKSARPDTPAAML